MKSNLLNNVKYCSSNPNLCVFFALQIIRYLRWARWFVPVGKMPQVLWPIIKDRRRVMGVHVDGMPVVLRDDLVTVHWPPGGATSWCAAVTPHQALAIYGSSDCLYQRQVPGTSDGAVLPMCLHEMCGRQRGTIAGPRFNIKTVFPGIGVPITKTRLSWDCLIFIMRIYRYSHYTDKMVVIVRPSYLYNEIPYTGKTASLYWYGPLAPLLGYCRPSHRDSTT